MQYQTSLIWHWALHWNAAYLQQPADNRITQQQYGNKQPQQHAVPAPFLLSHRSPGVRHTQPDPHSCIYTGRIG